MTLPTSTGTRGASTWVTSEHATRVGASRMLRPAESRIIKVEQGVRCAGCHKAGVIVTMIRRNGELTTAWTHDDGSFVEWTGEQYA